jgi:hypothetical protein
MAADLRTGRDIRELRIAQVGIGEGRDAGGIGRRAEMRLRVGPDQVDAVLARQRRERGHPTAPNVSVTATKSSARGGMPSKRAR